MLVIDKQAQCSTSYKRIIFILACVYIIYVMRFSYFLVNRTDVIAGNMCARVEYYSIDEWRYKRASGNC